MDHSMQRMWSERQGVGKYGDKLCNFANRGAIGYAV